MVSNVNFGATSRLSSFYDSREEASEHFDSRFLGIRKQFLSLCMFIAYTCANNRQYILEI